MAITCHYINSNSFHGLQISMNLISLISTCISGSITTEQYTSNKGKCSCNTLKGRTRICICTCTCTCTRTRTNNYEADISESKTIISIMLKTKFCYYFILLLSF